VRVQRVEAKLEAPVSSDLSCSVYWLESDADQGELGDAMTALAARMNMSSFGFLGWWDQSRDLRSYTDDIDQATAQSGYYSVGDIRLLASALRLPAVGGEWFWRLFDGAMRPNRICGALMPGIPTMPSGWSYAGLQLVLTDAALQVRPSRATFYYTLHALFQAFLAEVVSAGGVAVTCLRGEFLGLGMALTGSRSIIDQAAYGFRNFPAIDPIKVKHALEMSGSWL
jgi:hypothetical protein